MKVGILSNLVLTFALCANAWATDLCSKNPDDPMIGKRSETPQDVFDVRVPGHPKGQADVCTVKGNELKSGKHYSFDGLVIVDGDTPEHVTFDIEGKFFSTGDLNKYVGMLVYSESKKFPYDKDPAVTVAGKVHDGVTIISVNKGTHINAIAEGAKVTLTTRGDNADHTFGKKDSSTLYIAPLLPKP